MKIKLITAFGLQVILTFSSIANAGIALSSHSSEEKIKAAIHDGSYRVNRNHQRWSRMKMTIQDSGGRSRERIIQNSELEVEESTKSLIFFETPADVRNIGLLTVDYDAGVKSDDQWLYMPKLRRSTRIASSKRSGSFMGSDFTYGDMLRSNPDLYEHEIINDEVLIDGEPCWLVEVKPKTDAEKQESGTIKQHHWVSKEKLMSIRMKSWVRKGKKLRYVSRDDIRLINNIWTPHLVRARTVRNGKIESESVLLTLDVIYGKQGINDELFGLRTLEKGI